VIDDERGKYHVFVLFGEVKCVTNVYWFLFCLNRFWYSYKSHYRCWYYCRRRRSSCWRWRRGRRWYV
jgi:hypothetical protein